MEMKETKASSSRVSGKAPIGSFNNSSFTPIVYICSFAAEAPAAASQLLRRPGGGRGKSSIDRASQYQYDNLEAEQLEDEEEVLEKVETAEIRRHKNRSKSHFTSSFKH